MGSVPVLTVQTVGLGGGAVYLTRHHVTSSQVTAVAGLAQHAERAHKLLFWNRHRAISIMCADVRSLMLQWVTRASGHALADVDSSALNEECAS